MKTQNFIVNKDNSKNSLELDNLPTFSIPSIEKDKKTKKTKSHVLIIDDEQITRDVCASMLSHFNLDSIQAQNGEIGISEYTTNYKKLLGIILDITMPQMDGLTLYKKIREVDTQIPIIFSSGYSEGQISLDLRSLLNTYYIQKPYTIYDFKKMLIKAFDL